MPKNTEEMKRGGGQSLLNESTGYKTFGDWVKKQRTHNGLSMLRLATKACVARSTIHGIEHGTTQPTLKVAARIAGAFGEKLWLVLKCISL